MPKKTQTKFLKVQISVYKLLKENGHQSELNEVVEYIISAIICLNVVLIILESMDFGSELNGVLSVLRICFFIFFLIEYIIRVWIADLVMKDRKHPIKSRIRYMFTFRAIIDLLALLPVMLGHTLIDFRIFRILRLLRITQLTSLKRYTDTLIAVFRLKGAQLLASLFIVFIFMLASAVIIYDLETKAQPTVFNNILSSFWWSVATTTTIGYGDMYPITPMGRIFASIMSVAGVFIMAIPIGILTSGFFEISKKTDFNDSDAPEPSSAESKKSNQKGQIP